MEGRSPSAISALLLAIGWCLAVATHAQDGVLNKQTVDVTEEKFGGVAEVERVEFSTPQTVLTALEKAEAEVEESLRDRVLCFEQVSSNTALESDTEISTTGPTVFIGDPDQAPCDVIVVTGQLNIIVTNRTIRTLVYRMVVYLGERGTCTPRITRFSRAAESGSVSLMWESIPESRYTVEASADMKQWEELKRDIPSGGTSTTVTLPLTGRSRERYFRVRLQIDSLPNPNP